MRSARYVACLVATFALPMSEPGAETLMDRIERDEIVVIPRGEPDMAAAMRKARVSLPEFLALARKPRLSTSGFAVKVGIRDKDDVEYFWIAPFTEQNGRFSGRINNTPRSVKTVKSGQTYTFAEREVVDWLYHEHGKMKGNYTACVLLKREPGQREIFKERFGLECEP
ncbi:MAG: DUF2314 domain-containing protein [Hyphomicrobiales bacterium]|nr:DUF2314 domain-containing protein [Hyphomicrobiales bacterium]